MTHTMTETEKLKAALVEALLDTGFKNDPGCLSGIPGQEHFVLMPAAAEQIADVALSAAASRIEELEAAMGDIAEGLVPPIPHGHYLAHRHAVNVARVALRQALSDKG